MRTRVISLSLAGVVLLTATSVLTWAGAASARGPRDPFRVQQWGLDMIHAPEAWRYATGRGITVAVVDTGVDADHPDLKGRVVAPRGSDLISGGGARADTDIEGHGTNVAGIVAAGANDGIGIAGVAPNARILAVRVCDDKGMCPTETEAKGIRFAVDHGADVINLSFSEGLAASRVNGSLDHLLAAVQYAVKHGDVVVAAAGNLSLPMCQEPGAHAMICVGAVGTDSNHVYYSNEDATTLASYMVAPGGNGSQTGCQGNVLSTYSLEAPPAICPQPPGYASFSGTSESSPFVAGVAALVMSEGLSASAVVKRVTSSAQDLGAPGRDPLYGYGLADALSAVRSN